MARVLSLTAVRVGLETTPGTYQMPTETVKIRERVTPQIEADTVEIDNISFHAGMGDVVTIPDWATLSAELQIPLYKTLSYFETLLKISSLKKTAFENAKGSGFVFTPNTLSADTASIDLVLPDRKIKGKGAKASFGISGAVADIVSTTFSLQAAYEGRDIAAQSIVDIPPEEILIVRRATSMTLGGVEANISSFEFDMGAEINMEKFTHVGELHMSNYAPTLNLTMRLESGADDGFNAMMNDTAVNFAAEFTDREGNLVWELVIPNMKLASTPAFEDSDGIFVINREYRAVAQEGDDNFALYYYDTLAE
jgi:hypothetical protein